MYVYMYVYVILQVVAGNIDFSGPITFVDNDAETFDGGAIYLLSFSQFTLYPGAYLDFINNAGRYICNFVLMHKQHCHKFTV